MTFYQMQQPKLAKSFVTRLYCNSGNIRCSKLLKDVLAKRESTSEQLLLFSHSVSNK